MLRNCPHCGAANRERANQCYVCESPLPEAPSADALDTLETADVTEVAGDLARDILHNIPEPAAREAETAPEPAPEAAPVARAATVTEFRAPAAQSVLTAAAVADTPPAVEPEWKREVASKLEEYRSRRQRSGQDPQNSLPFTEESAEAEAPAAEPHPRESLRYASRSRPATPEHMEITAQPELDFDPSADEPMVSARLVPVARLGERVRAGVLDAAFVAITCGAFLLMFSYLIGSGGELAFDKVAAAVYGATFFLIYGLYFTLFTALGGATPGMLLSELHVVGFDGNAATPRQLLWRSFGYLVSAPVALLGFLWALWDEDQLTWHDRISQTYLTETLREPISTEHAAQSWKLF